LPNQYLIRGWQGHRLDGGAEEEGGKIGEEGKNEVEAVAVAADEQHDGRSTDGRSGDGLHFSQESGRVRLSHIFVSLRYLSSLAVGKTNGGSMRAGGGFARSC